MPAGPQAPMSLGTGMVQPWYLQQARRGTGKAAAGPELGWGHAMPLSKGCSGYAHPKVAKAKTQVPPRASTPPTSLQRGFLGGSSDMERMPDAAWPALPWSRQLFPPSPPCYSPGRFIWCQVASDLPAPRRYHTVYLHWDGGNSPWRGLRPENSFVWYLPSPQPVKLVTPARRWQPRASQQRRCHHRDPGKEQALH